MLVWKGRIHGGCIHVIITFSNKTIFCGEAENKNFYIVQFMGRRGWGSCPACKWKGRAGVIHSYKIYNIVIMISAMRQQRLSGVLVIFKVKG